jgi:hypothetical protein
MTDLHRAPFVSRCVLKISRYSTPLVKRADASSTLTESGFVVRVQV